MASSDIVTLVLAIYGALVSTVLAVREIMLDRRRLTLVMEYVAWVEYAQLTIINIGRRPVTIVEIGMEIGETNEQGKLYWDRVPRNALLRYVEGEPQLPTLPATIADGEHLAFPLSDGVSQTFLTNDTRVRLTVYDVEGRRYTKFRRRDYDPKWGQIHPRR